MSVAWPQDMVEAMDIEPCQALDNATVFGQYPGHECPGYRNRSLVSLWNRAQDVFLSPEGTTGVGAVRFASSLRDGLIASHRRRFDYRHSADAPMPCPCSVFRSRPAGDFIRDDLIDRRCVSSGDATLLPVNPPEHDGHHNNIKQHHTPRTIPEKRTYETHATLNHQTTDAFRLICVCLFQPPALEDPATNRICLKSFGDNQHRGGRKIHSRKMNRRKTSIRVLYFSAPHFSARPDFSNQTPDNLRGTTGNQLLGPGQK